MPKALNEYAHVVFPYKVMGWDTLQTDTGQALKPSPQLKTIGFIPVYADVISLQEEHGPDIDSGVMYIKGRTDDANE